LNKDKKLKSLFDDDNEGYPSRSEGDLAFMEKICYYGFTKEQCFEIFDRSNRSKYHEKQGYPQYREDLYEKALVYAQKDREISIEDLDFNELCNIARQCYSAKDSEKIKEGEDLIVAYFLYKYNFLALEDSQEIYVYREGIYIPNGETAIAKQTQRILGTLNSIHRTNEIIGHVKRSTYIPRDKFIEPLNLLCLENGIFNIDTMTLEKFSPEHIFLNKLPVEFNPNADCPKTKRFLREVVIPRDEWDNEDYDASDIATLQEFAGYLLYKNIIFNRAVMLYGEGENGKTTLINLIKEFLGRENVSNVPIQKLEKDKFAVASLLGKLANLHADLPKSALRETSTFKQITGGDTVDAEKKFKDNFSFKPYAKMMYAANTLPVTYDDTKAFWRRWLIFRFGNSFSEDDKNTNKDLLKELSSKEELSGLFNWAIEGLKRLLENKQFTTNKSTTEVREEYIRQSDSVGAFILDLIVEDNSSFEYKKYVYETYSDHCRTNGYEILPENTFHRIFHQKVRVRETHPLDPVTNKQKAAWKGIKILLKKEIEDVEKQKQL
jgi:putative DNA primase/helicase